MIEDNALDTAVGNVLCEYLPDNWEEMTKEELFSFLEDNCCEQYEYHSGQQIWEEIQSQKNSILQMVMGMPLRSVDVDGTKVSIGVKAYGTVLTVESDMIKISVNIPDAKWAELIGSVL